MSFAPADLVISGGDVLEPGGPRRRDIDIADGVVVSRLPADRRTAAPRLDARGRLVGAGLVDCQVNGAAGVDLSDRPDGWATVAEAMVHGGTTTFCPTLISARPQQTLAAIEVLDDGRRSDHPLATTLGGIHVEGPFLAPGRAGAHDRGALRPPDLDEATRWVGAGPIAIVTLAPELPGALEATRVLSEAGVTVSLGHSEASALRSIAALDAGARSVTHLFNAMAPFHHREPGLVGVALTDPRPIVMMIADGVHLDPLAVSLAWTSLEPPRRCLVSDTTAVSPLDVGSAPEPATTLGGTVIHREGPTVRTADGVLAGSAVTLLDDVRWIVNQGIATATEAWSAASLTPAGLLGRRDIGHLDPGARGDVVVLDLDLTPAEVIVGGRVLSG